MLKNVASQKWYVLATSTLTHAPVTGDAANITAKIAKDFAAASATNDVNPTELESGYYAFDLTQAETNADTLLLIPVSATANVQLVALPSAVFTRAVGANGNYLADVRDINGTAGIFSGGRMAVLSGYQGGMVWVDTVLGSAGTTSYVNGTVDKPVSSWANAQTIAAAVGLNTYRTGLDTLITLTAGVSDAVFIGSAPEAYGFSLECDSNTLTNCYVFRASFTDIFLDSGFLRECWLFQGAHTLVNPTWHDCFLYGTHTLGMNAAGALVMIGCFGEQSDPVTLDMVASGPNFTLTNLQWRGPLTVSNIEAGDTVVMTVLDGATVTLTGTGGDVTIGGFATIVDNRSGGTLTQSGNLAYTALKPTIAGRTADVTATGAIGIDLGNVENQGSTLALSATTIAAVSGAVGSVTGNVTGSVGSLATQAKADVNAEVVDALATDTYAEPSAPPAATSSIKDALMWAKTLARNKVMHNRSTGVETLRNDADSANIATSATSDDGTTTTRGKWS